MAKKLIIFGSGDMAELAHYYFTNDSDYSVKAFTVDGAFINESVCCGLPVVAFEQVKEIYPPSEYEIFIALSYSKLNEIRKQKFLKAISDGYTIASYVSSMATILNDGQIGMNCFILENNTIQPFVTIGDNVTLWSGNHIGHHSVVKNHSFIASHVVISGGVTVGEQCFIGVNATIRDHLSIGDKSVIGAGVLLLKSAQPESVYIGSPSQPSSRRSGELSKI